MSRARLILVHAVLGALSAGSLYCIVRDTERWPFSRYAMYSYLQPREDVVQLRVYGVSSRDGAEVPLVRFEYLQPLDRLRLRLALTELLRVPRKQALLETALEDTARRYEALRSAGRHQGPELRGVRLYRLRWRTDPWASNLDRPDERQLLREVWLGKR